MSDKHHNLRRIEEELAFIGTASQYIAVCECNWESRPQLARRFAQTKHDKHREKQSPSESDNATKPTKEQ